ncbi:MAG: zinc-binding dehydrogenase [Thermoanaerobaculia bacterium]
MSTITTEAWVLHKGSRDEPGPAQLVREEFSFPDITEDEVLVEPIFGCWEGNMSHALERWPIDICRLRREAAVVMGNAGVVRILQAGKAVTGVKEGDLCMLGPVGTADEFGNMLTVVGYDCAKSIGVLAKKIKLRESQVLPIPADTRHSYEQWAAFPVRYGTAWANWKVAYGSFRLQMSHDEAPAPHVWGWGGGVALAELALAKFDGCKVAMIASTDARLDLLRQMGIRPIDRRQFDGLDFDEARYHSDLHYKKGYLKAQSRFLQAVKEETGGEGVSIFIENIGKPVFNATLKALRTSGVITTVGWKCGMELPLRRATECMERHIHVHTHGSTYGEGLESMEFGERTGWMPPVNGTVYAWEDVPRLASDYAEGRIDSYFPIFEVNPL